jgi:aminopeptidase-like protein
MPDAIPYVTSYYKRTWGFCLSHNERQTLVPGQYRVVIDSTLEPGVMNYADLIVEGNTADEVMFSTYICHPTMANNEASGITVTTALAEWLQRQPKTRYTYRFVFVPETIGAIAYLADNLEHLRKHVKAGFQVTCVGDERAYSYLPSRSGVTLSDRVAKHVLSNTDPSFIEYTWLDRGSDERQWCSPGADLPIASIMRSKYGTYPEYHTSLDAVGGVVTDRGLNQTLSVFKKAIFCLEHNCVPVSSFVGEPFLTQYNLYPTASSKAALPSSTKNLVDFVSLADGKLDLMAIATALKLPFEQAFEISALLESNGVISTLEKKENPPG